VKGLRGFDDAAATAEPRMRVGWDGMFAQLQAIVDAGGDPNISQKSKEHKQLGEWLNGQRKAFRAGKLALERLAQLRSVDGLRGFA
jgi:hypothetical protein